jgi:D-aminopeptidase
MLHNRLYISADVKGVAGVVSHGNGQNLLLYKLPANVQLVRSWPRPLCMMDGIEQRPFDGTLSTLASPRRNK